MMNYISTVHIGDSKKATKFCKISTVDLTFTTKSKVMISQTFCVLLTKPKL